MATVTHVSADVVADGAMRLTDASFASGLQVPLAEISGTVATRAPAGA